MPIVETKTGRKLLKKAESMWLLPYTFDSELSDYVLGTTVYDLSSIIGDSIVLEQDDGDTATKTNEFTGKPLVINATSGDWKFTAQCLDLQNAVLRSLFSAYTNDTAGIAALKSEYATRYGLIRITFADNDTPDVWLPKVELNSRLLLQQMKTRGSQGNVAGIVLPHMCAVIDTVPTQSSAGTLYGFTDPTTGEVVYQVETPVLFVPKNKKPLFLNHTEEEQTEMFFDEINVTETDSCAHNRVVDSSEPDKYTIRAS